MSFIKDWLKHYGTPRRSGRYPYGSGQDPKQRNKDFLGYVRALSESGLSEVEIATGLGMTTSELRAKKSIEKNQSRIEATSQAERLKAKGMSNVAIGKRMGLNESSVRALLDPSLKAKADITTTTASVLRDAVQKDKLIDIGAGVESYVGVSRTKLNTAIKVLEDEGYTIHYLKTQQLGTGKFTTVKVLAPPGTAYSDVSKNRASIKTIGAYTEDSGRSYFGLEPIKSVSRDRIKIRYAEEGGKDKDGVIELRRGVDDISLGTAKYAQVRVGVDGTHYMKGMAIYADNMPKGVDIIYNSNKAKGTDPNKVFKEMKEDPDNPFGSVVRQKKYLDKNGKEQLSALNIVNEEGAWTDWSKNISSQVLSKQTPALAKKQLELAKNIKVEELDEIMSLTNPVVKRRLLNSFADDADSAAVHLKAAALPRQASHVILPVPSMKENEIYAPNYRNGEPVVLIRHPHGGTFEIPELRVNNKNADAKRILGDAIDAVGIHPKVAERLSGADFDGDTVLVIPNKNKDIKTSPSLKALKDFDTKAAYPPHDGMKTIDGGIYNAATGKVDYGSKKPKGAPKQMQMGVVSNLITDMTIRGATPDEIARAVKHSMVVIDAEKHHLDYKRSAIENNIAELKKKYQGGERAGASTLISKASSEIRVPYREEGKKVLNPKTGKERRVYVDPVTGEKLYQVTGETYVNKKGAVVAKTTPTTRMAEAKDARKLSSGTLIESIYADHANSLKALANKARLAAITTPNLVYSPLAKATHAPEVMSLRAKLVAANRNKPLERKAQLLANSIVSAKKAANPDMDAADLKKIKGQALEEARARTGAHKQKIEITDKEWSAIQMGAISHNLLSQIVQNTDLDAIKIRSTPRTVTLMTTAKLQRAQSMKSSGYTAAEIADALGVSTTTVQDALK
jgi:DNA-binding CsgD family transcriptional regulator